MRRRSKVTFYLSIAACFTIVAAACGSNGTLSGAALSESASRPPSPTADGGQLEWTSIEGQDTVLWFWAPW